MLSPKSMRAYAISAADVSSLRDGPIALARAAPALVEAVGRRVLSELE